jgi:hypothetical protein
MPGPYPNSVKTSALKSKILHVAQTSVYQVKVQPPIKVLTFLNARNFNYYADGENVELMCSAASLPGVNLFTHEATNDFAGMSEKMAYRKDFGNTLDLTFMVNNRYDVIELFDGWVDFIAGQTTNNRGYENSAVSYRMNYPNSYRSPIHVTKFEKNARAERKRNINDSYQLRYTFIDAFPISIAPTQVSYEASDVLKYNISMSYTRYIRERSFA